MYSVYIRSGLFTLGQKRVFALFFLYNEWLLPYIRTLQLHFAASLMIDYSMTLSTKLMEVLELLSTSSKEVLTVNEGMEMETGLLGLCVCVRLISTPAYSGCLLKQWIN